jgi:hypothetical protein
MLNYEAIESMDVKTQPYPYAIVKNSIVIAELNKLLDDFPSIDHPGSIPLTAVEGGEAYDRLIDDLQSVRLSEIIEQKFSVPVVAQPRLITLRGQMREKDGRIHTDSKTKLITVLLYLNQDWQDPNGRLRILNNGTDLENYIEEISPEAGTMVIFKVTDNCWHGHTTTVGKRLSLQLNYLTGAAAKGKHQFFHSLSAKLKKLLK